MGNLTTIEGMQNLHTDQVTNMGFMFFGCSKLTSLDLSEWNTENVTSMSRIFGNCSLLTSVGDLSGWDTGKVTHMDYMFYNCSSLTSLDLSEWNTGNVIYMYSMFDKCSSLTSLDLSGWNTGNVTNMNYMFSNSSLTKLDLSNFDTGKVKEMNSMFYKCSSLATIYVGNGWTTAAVTSSEYMFSICTSLKGMNGTTYNASYIDKTYARVDAEGAPGYLSYKPYAVYNSSTTTLTFYCDGKASEKTGTVYDLNEGDSAPVWYKNGKSTHVTNVAFDASFANARPTTTYYWFYGMTSLTSITGIEYLHTDNVTTFSSMFTECSSLTSVGDLSTWDTSNVTSMYEMFLGCSSLTVLDLSTWDTGNVTNMRYMFSSCSSLIKLELSGWNTGNVTNTAYMFSSCSSLTELDLSKWNTSHATNMMYMFSGCSNLKTIYVGSGWSTTDVNSSTKMFTGCTSLKGMNGTQCDGTNNIDKTYARVDGGTSNPGYLSCKPYAVYDSSNTTLTFYYDNLRFSREGAVYDLNTGKTQPDWHISSIWNNITTVTFDASFANAQPTSTNDWFANMTNLTTINGIEYLNTSMVTTMSGMFSGCSSLTSLALTGFNTANVENTSHMFYGCTGLTTLDLSSFNTEKVSATLYMFYNCSGLTTICTSDDFDVSQATSSGSMFEGCTSLVGMNGTAYSASHTDAEYARIDAEGTPCYLSYKPYAVYNSSTTTLTFYCDGKASEKTGTVYDMNEGDSAPVWYKNGKSTHVTNVAFDASFANARPTTTYYWFYGMTSLTSITGIEYLHTDNVTTFSSMFTECSSLTSVGDLSTWDTSNVTSMYEMFLGCSSLTVLDLSTWDTGNVTNMRYMFSSCSSLIKLELSGWNTGNVTNTAYMFSSCSSLTELDLSKWNTTHVTNMMYMFNRCSSLKTIYVGSGWSTTNVTSSTSSTSMFANCTSLKGMNGTQCDGTNNIDKTYARVDQGPSSTAPGYLSARKEYAIFNATYGTLTHYYDGLMNQREAALDAHDAIFYDQVYETGDYLDRELDHDEVIDVVYDPSVANFPYIHGGLWCSGLSNLNSVEGLEYLNASGNTFFASFFSGCSQLKSLDLSSWDISNARDMSYMFSNCTNLKTIYVGENWSTDAVTASTQMFKGCTSLVGGNGTTYNASYIDKTYARVDAEETPGYLSYKAYVVYDSSTTTLTFYCDGKASEKTGTVYDLNDGMIDPAWYTDHTNASVTKVIFDASFANARPNSTYNWFCGMTNLATINGIGYLNTSVVTRMSGMFSDCSSLTSLDLTGFNTEEAVYMNHMFYGCTGLTTLDLSSFNTSRVNTILYMFYGCSALTTIYASDDWDMTTAALNSGSMFEGCTSLKGMNGTAYSASHMNAEYAIVDGLNGRLGYLSYKPYAVYDSNSTILTFRCDGKQNTHTLGNETMYDLPADAEIPGYNMVGFTKAVFDPSFAITRPTSTKNWFIGCNNMIEIQGLENLNTSEVTDMNCMFAGCSGLTSLDLSSFDTRNVTNMGEIFNVCSSLQTIYVGDGWSTAALTSENQYMFYGCSSLKGGNGTACDGTDNIAATYAHIDGGPSNPGYFTEKSAFKKGDVNMDGEVNVSDVTMLVSMILGNTTMNTAADVNTDGEVNVSDVTALVSIILGN